MEVIRLTGTKYTACRRIGYAADVMDLLQDQLQAEGLVHLMSHEAVDTQVTQTSMLNTNEFVVPGG